MIHHEHYRAVRRSEPIAPKARHVPPPRPPAERRPAFDAYQLVRAWRTARLNRDWANAARLLAELEKLAERKPRAGGWDDEQYR
jgi:hypothetical protein